MAMGPWQHPLSRKGVHSLAMQKAHERYLAALLHSITLGLACRGFLEPHLHQQARTITFKRVLSVLLLVVLLQWLSPSRLRMRLLVQSINVFRHQLNNYHEAQRGNYVCIRRRIVSHSSRGKNRLVWSAVCCQLKLTHRAPAI